MLKATGHLHCSWHYYKTHNLQQWLTGCRLQAGKLRTTGPNLRKGLTHGCGISPQAVWGGAVIPQRPINRCVKVTLKARLIKQLLNDSKVSMGKSSGHESPGLGLSRLHTIHIYWRSSGLSHRASRGDWRLNHNPKPGHVAERAPLHWVHKIMFRQLF